MAVLPISIRLPGEPELVIPLDFGSSSFESVVAVGRDPSCPIRLRAPGMRPVHAFLAAVSNHRFVEFTQAEEGHEPYEIVRVDTHEFSIGPYRLRFSEPYSTGPSRPAASTPWIERGALAPMPHPRGAMGRSRRIEIQLNDRYKRALDHESQRAGQTPSVYASSCLEAEARKSARTRRDDAEDGHGPHPYEVFMNPRLLDRLAREARGAVTLERAAARLVAIHLAKRAYAASPLVNEGPS